MNESRSSQKQNLSGLMVVLLFGVFAVCILAVLLSGTSVYDRLTKRDSAAFEARSAAQYLSTRIHQAENAESLAIKTGADGNTMISILQTYDFDQYETLLYCQDGWLYELFVESEAEIDLSAGERILPAEQIDGSYENGMLTVAVTDEKGTQQIIVLLRGGEETP